MAIVQRRRSPENSGTLARGRQWDPFEMMRDVMRFDPLRDLVPFVTRTDLEFIPTFDVKETKDAYVFKGDFPGVKEDEVQVSLTGSRLTISGERMEEKRDDSDQYYAHERSYGSFMRTFTLPDDIDADKVNAEFKDGVLTVQVPKKPEAQPKRIELKAGKSEKKEAKA
jgi:HSP20 family protein